jgi:hypothetical protein
MCRIFHPAAAQYTLLSAAHGSLSKIDHVFDTNLDLTTGRKLK